MNKRLYLILSVVLFACSLQANETLSSTSANELDSLFKQFQIEEVTVSARALEKDVIVPQKLTGKALEQMNALSVADAIRYFSGIQIKDYGGVGGIKTVNIRSMGTNHVGVYYNGIQLGNAQNGQVDLGKYSLDNLETIELYNGQKSDIFQSAREFGNAGSIYLTTRRPKFQDGKNINLRAQMRAGSFALVNPSVSLDYRFSETLSMNVNAEYVYSSGKYKFRYRRVTPSGEVAYDTTAVRQNGDINAVRAEASLNHYYSTTGFWKAQAYFYNSERGVPGAIVNNVWKNGERLWDRNGFVQASWQDAFFNRWNMKVNAKYACYWTRYRSNDTNLLRVDNRFLQQELYLTWANKVQLFPWWDVAAAYDIQYNSLQLHTEAARLSHWLSAATAFNFKNYLRIQAGVLGTFIAPLSSPVDGGNAVSMRCTPSVFLSYRPTQRFDLRLNAFYKQSYRFPTFNDLYYTDIGNAELKPEFATQHNVGLVYSAPLAPPIRKGSVLRIQIDAYYNKVQDKIVAYPKGQQFRWTMLNLGVVDIRGIDAQTELNLVLPMDFVLSNKLQYTYQRAIDVTNPKDTYYGHQIPYIPWHSGSVIVGFGWRNYHLSYSFIYVGERYNQQENILRNYEQPWYTHDLSLSAEWKLPRAVGLRACVELNNLLGQDYEVIQNYPMPKQNGKITLTVTY